MRPLASILLVVLVSARGWSAETRDGRQTAISKAASFLWSKQGADGGWHSETYGLLRSGQSLTPFILLALLESPDAPQEAVDRAVRFIRAGTSRDGEVGRSDPSLEDYPNFATSLAARALLKAGKPEGVDRMVAALRRQQFREDNGWTKDHPTYGGWGMGGPIRKPPFPGHVDLSMTRHALQAAGDASGRVKAYLERCRNADGGFMFSPVVLDANKAGAGKSYGTATADGVLALLALHEPVGPALDWLSKHHRVDGVPGFDESTAKWRDGLLYYYLATSAQAFQAAKQGPQGWQREMVDGLIARQRGDGSFQNASFLMKEDDPLIATTLALTALLATRP
jgi:hypothetical protein